MVKATPFVCFSSRYLLKSQTLESTLHSPDSSFSFIFPRPNRCRSNVGFFFVQSRKPAYLERNSIRSREDSVSQIQVCLLPLEMKTCRSSFREGDSICRPDHSGALHPRCDTKSRKELILNCRSRRRSILAGTGGGEPPSRVEECSKNEKRRSNRGRSKGESKNIRKRITSEFASEERSSSRKKSKVFRKSWIHSTTTSLYRYLNEFDRALDERLLRDDEKVEINTNKLEHEWSGDTSSDVCIQPVTAKFPQTDTTVVYLRNNVTGAEVYVVGTSHVSGRSVDEVREVISTVNPDFVMVELCKKRQVSLDLKRSGGKIFLPQFSEKATKADTSALSELFGSALAELLASAFAKLQPFQGFEFGKELQVALEEGRKVGAEIILGDQDIEKTLAQLGDFDLRMSTKDVFRFFGQPIPKDLVHALRIGQGSSSNEMNELFRDRKVVRRFNEEMKREHPISIRDKFMVKALRSLSGKVVAVVGLAHVDGFEQLWHEYNEADQV